MSKCYILDKRGDKFALDATTEVTYSVPAKLTKFPIESGRDVADHYFLDNPVISFKGVISSAKSVSSLDSVTKHPSEYIEGLERIRRNKEPFTLYHITAAKKTDNCFFTSLTLTQNAKNGDNGRAVSVRVEFTAEQVRYGQLSEIEVVPSTSFTDRQGDKVFTSGIKEEIGEEQDVLRQVEKQREKIRQDYNALFPNI